MAMELVTGYAGKAHVTSYQGAAIQAGIVGVDNGVLSYVGQGMKAVATSANNIRIYDGVALIGGKAVVIDRDTYQDVAIANGTVGKYRNDIIYIKYTKDAFTGAESVTFDVKQGAAGNSGIDPALTTNNLYSTGTLTSEIPFKRVRLNGLAIESVENMHDNVPSLSELNRKLPELVVASSSTISYTPDRDCNVLVTYEVCGWGFGGTTWQIEITVSASSGDSPIRADMKRGVFDGTDGIYKDVSTSAYFTGLRAGVTYTFKRVSYAGSGGMEANPFMKLLAV
ncbi:MAG: hypothetical protein ACLTLQ_19250 [[Clostridium] scindens]|uniref:hypothetical protein n=1 Tax=Clostridium scindens (strain JCM 10418 / VPI 12708) TaxID=29347 RepID=UPI00399314D0